MRFRNFEIGENPSVMDILMLIDDVATEVSEVRQQVSKMMNTVSVFEVEVAYGSLVVKGVVNAADYRDFFKFVDRLVEEYKKYEREWYGENEDFKVENTS